ncbi:MAG: peptidylprolyl isomerase, partial [Pseudomonadota bacterium]
MSGKLTYVLGIAALVATGLTAPMASAQNLFAPVAQVDEAVITEFEVQQRSRFLQVLNSPGGDRASVIEELVRDRLRVAETRQRGATLNDGALEQGLIDFAARANLTVEEFTAGLESAGVARETFRDFVGVSLLWRDYIRARFGARVQISEDEIDRAVNQVNTSSGIEVLVSEIIIPAPPNRAAAVLAQAETIAQSTTEAEFSSFARRFSATASRGRGGRLDWLPITDLPASLRPILLALGPGEVTQPLPIPNAVALFQLRDIRETSAPVQAFEAVEYAAYYIDGGRTPAPHTNP